MIVTQLMQHGGMEVANVDRIANNVVTEVVSFAVDCTAFETTACHPHGEAARMMVATVIFFRQSTLRIDRTPKFTAPDDQRVFKQAALLQVGDQTIRCLVKVTTLIGQSASRVGVRVPVVVVDLNETNAAFDHPPSQQHRVSQSPAFLRLFPVQFKG